LQPVKQDSTGVRARVEVAAAVVVVDWALAIAAKADARMIEKRIFAGLF